VRQQEMAEVIGREAQFEAVVETVAGCLRDAGVADQRIQLRCVAREPAGKRADVVRVGQVEAVQQVAAWAASAKLGQHVLTGIQIARCDQDVRAGAGKRDRGLRTEARRGAGDQDRLAGQVVGFSDLACGLHALSSGPGKMRFWKGVS
jgi:hypothetical protein